MDAIEIMTRFQRFEKDRSLFDELVCDAPWWDSVRYDVFSFLGQELLGRKVTTPDPALWRRVAASAWRGLKRWQLYRELDRTPRSILLIRAPRVRKGKSRVDTIVDPIGALFAGRTKAIDTLPRRYHVPVIQKSSRSGSVPEDLEKTIAALLKEFSIGKDKAGALDRIIRYRRLVFETEFASYNSLFERSGPSLVILVQNGIEKALFAAAHANGIPTAEVQHGLAGFAHPAYSYCSDIDYAGQTTFPDLFLTFSRYWISACHYPADACLPVGNDSYYVEPTGSQASNSVMVISAAIYHEVLVPWVRAISALAPGRRILYKLHPGQQPYAADIIEEFRDLSNVEVVADPIQASALLKDVSHVVVVCSTVAYEALQAGLGVCILPVLDYQSHRDILDLPGVVVPPTPEALNRALGLPANSAAPPRFFDPFNPDAARSALEAAIRQRQLHGGGRP